jgi:hypothetical protein
VIGLSIWEESFSKLNIKIMKVNNLPKKGMATFKIWIVGHWNFSRSTASLQHPLALFLRSNNIPWFCDFSIFNTCRAPKAGWQRAKGSDHSHFGRCNGARLLQTML